MTSLTFFDTEQLKKTASEKPKLEWGTGKPRSKPNTTEYRSSGTFLYTGEPMSQNYRNTDLTLSNVRLNDEIVPAPLHSTDMSSHEIPLKFPSNHPYTSHISEKAIFPTATTKSDDRPSTCADPYIVTHKSLGNPFRREVHYHGLQRERHKTFKWPDQHFMQLPRSVSDVSSLSKQSIYPWPRKMLAPNTENSTTSNPTTTNVVKNKEKTSFETAYQSDYGHSEGHGTHVVFDTTATVLPTEQLRPHFQKTFEPSTPIDKNNNMQINAQPSQNLERSKTTLYSSPTTKLKWMSETEKHDEQLSIGTDYINLPAHHYPTDQAPTWIIVEGDANDNRSKTPREIRYLRHSRPLTTGSQIARDHHASHQQMDAENRLQHLELIRPKENIDLLNGKFQRLQNPRHARPILPQYRDDYVNTLYDQMGNYVHERAGLYHTENYDPNSLAQAIPELESPAKESIAQDQYHSDDLLHRTGTNFFQHRAFGDYHTMRDNLLNRLRLPQDAGTVNSRVQEGPQAFVHRETVYGQAYNTRKFLQENTLAPHGRVNPTNLMSTTYNHNLERARTMNSFSKTSIESQPTPISNSENLVSPVLRPPMDEEIYSTKTKSEHTDGYARRSTVRVYDSPFKGEPDLTVHQIYQHNQRQQQQQSTVSSGTISRPGVLPNAAKTAIRLPGPEIVARYLEPKVELPTTYQRSYKEITFHESIPRLSHVPNLVKTRSRSMNGVNNIDKQVKLRELQDRWSKTQAQRDYHVAHPEAVPDVGGCTIRAKKEILIADTIAKRGMVTVR